MVSSNSITHTIRYRAQKIGLRIIKIPVYLVNRHQRQVGSGQEMIIPVRAIDIRTLEKLHLRLRAHIIKFQGRWGRWLGGIFGLQAQEHSELCD